MFGCIENSQSEKLQNQKDTFCLKPTKQWITPKALIHGFSKNKTKIKIKILFKNVVIG